MSDLLHTKNTRSYKEALLATEAIDPPAIAFAKPGDIQGSDSRSATIIRQNNTQIQLLVKIAETLEEIQADPRKLINNRGKAPATTIPEDLIDKLQKLSLGEKPKEGKGVLRVFKDPYKILKEEQEKLKS